MFHRPLFTNHSQVDVATVLMLLGEATIWKAIWSRMRGRRLHWTHFIFTVSPGWAPLAGSLFAAMNGGSKPFNLIFDKIPEGYSETGLMLTNLNSGATHTAEHAILQNIWQTWTRGIEEERTSGLTPDIDLTKEVGVMEVNLDRLVLRKTKAICLQLTCLVIQIIAAVTFLALKLSWEVVVILGVALFSQVLLVFAITPRKEAWKRVLRGNKPSPMMLHKGLESTKALIIPVAILEDQEISLEEFCWDFTLKPNAYDKAKVACAAFTFLSFILSIVLIGWMDLRSKQLYLATGILGLLANTVDAVLQPQWSRNLAEAFTGRKRCAPRKGKLFSCVGILLAGRFPGATIAATCLYPDNIRTRETLEKLSGILAVKVCDECQQAIRKGDSWKTTHRCGRTIRDPETDDCATLLAEEADICESKQLSDALAAASHVLTPDEDGKAMIETNHPKWSSFTHGYW